ncbi:unnamed protein product [Amoebophrya sp. A25]|nr:unnamed protein product [Amoebophrya sp. A25]|eukprot:GSA25T00002692001.1
MVGLSSATAVLLACSAQTASALHLKTTSSLKKATTKKSKARISSRSQRQRLTLTSKKSHQEPWLYGSGDALTLGALHPKVVEICESAVRKAEGTQCSDLDLVPDYVSSSAYHACLDDWEGVHGLASDCEKHHTKIDSPCGKACLYKGLRALAAKHGSVSELLKWGVTDFSLWNQLVALAKPSADGLSEEELATVFLKCSDGGDHTVLPIPRVRNIFACLDGNEDARLDGAELTQPGMCFRSCLTAKEPAGHLELIPDDADVTDVLSLWLADGEGAARQFKTMLGPTDNNCLDGVDGPCEGCESYHIDFNPMAKREEHESAETRWDESGDLLEECKAYHERCEPHFSDFEETVGAVVGSHMAAGESPAADASFHAVSEEECTDPFRRQYCMGVERLTETHVSECTSYYGKCCANLMGTGAPGANEFHLEDCKPCEKESECPAVQGSVFDMVHASADQGGCFVPAEKDEMAAVGAVAGSATTTPATARPSMHLDYQRLAFCAGVFERARYDMIESGKLDPHDATTVPDDVGAEVHPGLVQTVAMSDSKKRLAVFPSEELTRSTAELDALVADFQATTAGAKEVKRTPFVSLLQTFERKRHLRRHQQMQMLGRRQRMRQGPPAGSVSGAGSRAKEPLPLVPVGDETSPMNLSPDQQAAAASAPVHVIEVRETNYPAHAPHPPRALNADLAHAPGAVPAMQAGDYDPTVYEDPIREPRCPTETFREKRTGEMKVIRNEEYYKKFCAWMQEVAKPSEGWDLGHFVDPATKQFANSQFLPDSTCSPEVVIKGHTDRIQRSEFDDDNVQNCLRAHELCLESGEPGSVSCGYVESDVCMDVDFPEPKLPATPPSVDLADSPKKVVVGSAGAAKADPMPEPASTGSIPAATGEAGEAIPLGTGADLPGGKAQEMRPPPPTGTENAAPPAPKAAATAATGSVAPAKGKAALGIVTPETVAAPITATLMQGLESMEKTGKRRVVFKVTVEEE